MLGASKESSNTLLTPISVSGIHTTQAMLTRTQASLFALCLRGEGVEIRLGWSQSDMRNPKPYHTGEPS